MRSAAGFPAGTPRAGPDGGRRWPPIRRWRPRRPNGPPGPWTPIITARRPACWPRTWTLSGRRDSPRSARCGNVETTGCSAPCSADRRGDRAGNVSVSWQTKGMSTMEAVDHGASAPEDVVSEPCVLLKLGEIVLKGRNRQQFEHILHGSITMAGRGTGVPVKVWQRDGVIVIRMTTPPGEAAAAADTVAARLRDVPGIVRVCRAQRVAKTPEAAVAAAIELTAGKQGTFAVRPRRRDKRFPVTSAELALLIGP